jgi:hypothetical protein
MPTDLTLSEEVRSYIDTLDWEYDRDLSPEERLEAKEARKIIKVIVSEVIKSRETLTDSELKGIEVLIQTNPDLIAHLLDEYYSREVVDAVQGYVRRTLQLSRMEAADTPSSVTNAYLREATRTFILGLPQACIALCRAALEQGMKERLGYQLTGSFIKFHDLIDEAYKYHLLDRTTKEIARHIAKDADDVLHEKPADSMKASEVLVKLRGLIQHLYSTEGHL